MRVLEQGASSSGTSFSCEIAGCRPAFAPMRSLDDEQKRELEETIRTLKSVIASIEGKPSRKMAQNVVALNA